MTGFCLRAGRSLFVFGMMAVALTASGGTAYAGEPFPFDHELMLDARPMRPIERVPVLTVSPRGSATIDLWCQTVHGRVALTEDGIRIETDPLPQTLPRYRIDGQCTPARIEADAATLTALTQATGWRRQDDAIVLIGPQTLKFRPAGN